MTALDKERFEIMASTCAGDILDRACDFEEEVEQYYALIRDRTKDGPDAACKPTSLPCIVARLSIPCGPWIQRG